VATAAEDRLSFRRLLETGKKDFRRFGRAVRNFLREPGFHAMRYDPVANRYQRSFVEQRQLLCNLVSGTAK
jgi:hypothetical protein